MSPNPRTQNPIPPNYPNYQRWQQPAIQERETSIYAILAIIFSFLVPIAGLVLGIIAVVKINKNPNLKGKGMAIAAIVIGGILTLIVPVLLAIGSLAYFGVLSPEKFLPQKCVMQPGIGCIDFNLKTDGTTDIRLQNSLGYQIYSATLEIEKECSPSEVIIKNGESATFICKGKAGKRGDRYTSRVVLSYTISETGLQHQNIGSLTAQYG